MTRIADLIGSMLRRRREPPRREVLEPQLTCPALPRPSPPPREVVAPALVRQAQIRAAQPCAAPLPPREAARRFVAWMRELAPGEHLWKGDAGLWAQYLEHCQCERLTPLPDNVLGEALGELAQRSGSGLTKRVMTIWIDQGGQRVRQRPTLYIVAPAEPAAQPGAGDAAPPAGTGRRPVAGSRRSDGRGRVAA